MLASLRQIGAFRCSNAGPHTAVDLVLAHPIVQAALADASSAATWLIGFPREREQPRVHEIQIDMVVACFIAS